MLAFSRTTDNSGRILAFFDRMLKTTRIDNNFQAFKKT
jgi:hypothetical protein